MIAVAATEGFQAYFRRCAKPPKVERKENLNKFMFREIMSLAVAKFSSS